MDDPKNNKWVFVPMQVNSRYVQPVEEQCFDSKIAKLYCHKCNLFVECGKDYFGTRYFVVPHISDKKYYFLCTKCVDKPVLTHLKKKWQDIALCALTTLEMMAGWSLFASTDVEAFVDSNYDDMAVGKGRGENDRWKRSLRRQIVSSTCIHCQTIDGQTFYALLRKNLPPPTEAQFFVPERILKKHKTPNGENRYKVKWEGFAEKYATWEPEENLVNWEGFSASQQNVVDDGDCVESDEEGNKEKKRGRSTRVRRLPSSLADHEVVQNIPNEKSDSEKNAGKADPSSSPLPSTFSHEPQEAPKESEKQQEKQDTEPKEADKKGETNGEDKEKEQEEERSSTPATPPSGTKRKNPDSSQEEQGGAEKESGEPKKSARSPSPSPPTPATPSIPSSSTSTASSSTSTPSSPSPFIPPATPPPNMAKKNRVGSISPPPAPPKYYGPITAKERHEQKLKLIAEWEKDKANRTPTRHHTFLVTCAKCSNKVPVTELGLTVISPTCTNANFLCGKCTGDKHLVTYSAEKCSLREVVLRALFLLHVQNPMQDFYTAADVVNAIRSDPSTYCCPIFNPTGMSNADVRTRVGKLMSDHRIVTLFPGSGRYQYAYDSQPDLVWVGEKKEKKPKPQRTFAAPLSALTFTLSPSTSRRGPYALSPTPPQTPPQPPSQYQIPSQLLQAPTTISHSPPSTPPSTHSHPSSSPPPPPPPNPLHQLLAQPHAQPFAQLLSQSLTHLLKDQPAGTPQTPPLEPQPQPQPQSQPPPQLAPPSSSTIPDVFVGWHGEEDFFGFLRFNLGATLAELRTEIQNRNLVENNKFSFLYKKAPVHVSQESTMFVRECVVQTEDDYNLRVKRTN